LDQTNWFAASGGPSDERKAEMTTTSEGPARAADASTPSRLLSEEEQRLRRQATANHGTGFVNPPSAGFVNPPSAVSSRPHEVSRAYVDAGREVEAGQPASGPVTGGATRPPNSVLLIGAYVVFVAIACIVIWVLLRALIIGRP
jgi:hypothetical protein